MEIRGLSKLTLLDYPGHIACTVFTGGCNFRCPFCHNGGLVLQPDITPLISEEYFFEFLSSRKNKLEGVCITGGEPTLRPDLKEFLRKIADLGFLVKLDTNGYQPKVVKELINEKLVNMIAMDIKNSPDKYALTVGLDPEHFDIGRINESISILKGSDIPYEFRTTAVRELHEKSDFYAIGEWIAGPSQYFIQNYKESEDTIFRYDNTASFTPFTDIDLLKFLSIVRTNLPNSHIRGVED